MLHVCRLVDKQMHSEAEAVQLVYAGRVKEHEALARKKEWAYNSARWRANMANYWYELAEMVYEAVERIRYHQQLDQQMIVDPFATEPSQTERAQATFNKTSRALHWYSMRANEAEKEMMAAKKHLESFQQAHSEIQEGSRASKKTMHEWVDEILKRLKMLGWVAGIGKKEKMA